jgi:hypothetical protein
MRERFLGILSGAVASRVWNAGENRKSKQGDLLEREPEVTDAMFNLLPVEHAVAVFVHLPAP